MDDRELLDAYARNRSEAAFSELVRRHLAWVYSVALRHTGNEALAKDIAQSVFVLLAQKAGSLRSGTVLAGWLFRTTRFVGNRALRAENRRKIREQTAASMIAPTIHSDENEAVWKQLEPHLDEAVAALSEADRQAILLRFYEKKPLLEIGQHLGLSEEAAKKRVSRAVQKMRDFLVRRDVAFGGTLLAGLMAQHTVQAVPVTLAATVSKTAALAVSPSAVLPRLAQETLNVWRWTRYKIIAGVTLSLCGFAWMYFALAPHAPITSNSTSGTEIVLAEAPPQMNMVAAAPEAPAPPATQASPSTNTDGRTMHFRVVAKDTGEPISGAPLAVSIATNGDWKQRFDLSTDQNGNADIPYPSDTGRLDIGVIASGWAARFVTWRTDSDPQFPAEYTLRVDRMTNSISGRLVDDQGQPVANATVEMNFAVSDMAQQENTGERIGFPTVVPVTKSDQNGWWTCAVADPNARYFQVRFLHPDFALTTIEWRNPELWTGKLITTMNRRLTLTGRILAEDGTPVGGARIDHDPASMSLGSIRTEADPQGWFTLEGLSPGAFDLIVTAPGFAQTYIKTNLKAGMEPVEVRLPAGKTLRLRIVDEHGNPIANATAAATGPAGMYWPGIYWKAESGPDGRVEWASAPATNWANICFSKSPEFAMTQVFYKKVDDEEHVIRLQRMLAVTGRVTDARTGQLIQGEIKAFPGYTNPDESWWRGDTTRSTNGTFHVQFGQGNSRQRFSVEAPGYAPFISDWLYPDSSSVIDISLQPLDPSKP